MLISQVRRDHARTEDNCTMEILRFVILFDLNPAMAARSQGRDFLPSWTDKRRL
jgi:hypothetical protein